MQLMITCVFTQRKDYKTDLPLEVRTEALSIKIPIEYPISANKRIEKYKEKWTA